MIDQEHTVTSGWTDPPDGLNDICVLLEKVWTIPNRFMVHYPVSQEPESVIALMNEVPIAWGWREVREHGLDKPRPFRGPQALVIGLTQERCPKPKGKLGDNLAGQRCGSSLPLVENHVCISESLELARLKE